MDVRLVGGLVSDTSPSTAVWDDIMVVYVNLILCAVCCMVWGLGVGYGGLWLVMVCGGWVLCSVRFCGLWSCVVRRVGCGVWGVCALSGVV